MHTHRVRLIHARAHAEVIAKLEQACIEFEGAHGEAGAVSDGAFGTPPEVVVPWDIVNCSEVPWPFNWTQFPRWMNGYSDADRAAILREMTDVIDAEGAVYIPADETWREMVLASWAEIGGERQDLLQVFDRADQANPQG